MNNPNSPSHCFLEFPHGYLQAFLLRDILPPISGPWHLWARASSKPLNGLPVLWVEIGRFHQLNAPSQPDVTFAKPRLMWKNSKTSAEAKSIEI